MKSLTLLFIPLLLLANACHHARETTVDKMTFYSGYGFRPTNDIVMYQIDRAHLLKDDSATFAPGYVFNATQVLSREKYAIAADLLNHVPLEMVSGAGKTYGSPGSHDQSGYVIILENDGGSKRFNIDEDDTKDQSKSVLAFKQRVKNVLNQLR